jgi:26S proteasome regulatory subunit N12
MATLGNVNQLFKELKAEFGKSTRDLKKCGTLLEQLKISLIQISYMPTTDSQASQQELIVARDTLEIGAEHSVMVKNIQSFERYISQLKCYYYDYKNMIPESPNKYKLLGLNLLYLLSQNRVAEFHTELELLPCEIIQSNKFIKHPLSLEQCLMEGRYNKLFKAKDDSPADCFNLFIDILHDTVRNEIGACLERAYEKVSIQEAGKRLNLSSKDDMTSFAKKRNWTLGGDGLYHFISQEGPKVKEPIPSVELAEMAITYARELEMIV